MKELILGKVRDAGLAFAAYARKEDEALDGDTLREAFLTGHVTPDELAEAFILSVLENLGLENNIEQRREDRIEKALVALEEGRSSITPWTPLPKTRRAFVEKLVDAIYQK